MAETWDRERLVRLIPEAREFDWIASGIPWVNPRAEFNKVTNEELARRYEAMPAGVMERQGTSSNHPVRVPSLIGLEEIKYLDASGLVHHRSIGDLMRYDIVNTGLDLIAHFGDFQPSDSEAPFGVNGMRYSDEQLYALALYIYYHLGALALAQRWTTTEAADRRQENPGVASGVGPRPPPSGAGEQNERESPDDARLHDGHVAGRHSTQRVRIPFSVLRDDR